MELPENYVETTTTPVQPSTETQTAAPYKKPSHCFSSQTDFYSEIIGYRLPYGSAGNLRVSDDGSMTFSSDSPYRSRTVNIQPKGLVRDNVQCKTAAKSCQTGTTELSVSQDKVQLLFIAAGVLTPPNSHESTISTLLEQLDTAKEQDKKECELYQEGSCI